MSSGFHLGVPVYFDLAFHRTYCSLIIEACCFVGTAGEAAAADSAHHHELGLLGIDLAAIRRNSHFAVMEVVVDGIIASSLAVVVLEDLLVFCLRSLVLRVCSCPWRLLLSCFSCFYSDYKIRCGPNYQMFIFDFFCGQYLYICYCY